jgi:hypothetical protein
MRVGRATCDLRQADDEVTAVVTNDLLHPQLVLHIRSIGGFRIVYAACRKVNEARLIDPCFVDRALEQCPFPIELAIILTARV